MPPTEQQQRIIAHDHDSHGRVVAGPGTGKSWTAIELLLRIHSEHPDLKMLLLTFTRAATGELIKKVSAQGIDWLDPSTIHAYALRLLLKNAAQSSVVLPPRIPDSWETKSLIHKDLSRKLRERGFSVDSRDVAKLEREMGAQWEALDPSLQLIADINPELRSAYLGEWQRHRQRFGYLLLAEIPFRAGNLVEDFAPDLEGMRFMVVDEYQDLNRADIRLLKALAAHGVRILAIGDDDQSIYGFRMAAPIGIAEFPATFAECSDYPLTVSMRCGSNIVLAATSLIETAPSRIARPRLASVAGSPPGTFAYLRFANQDLEARGVAKLIAHRRDAGVSEGEIAVLVRSSADTWTSLLAPALAKLGIQVVDTEWVVRALADPPLRKALAVARLALDRADSLAWWTLLTLTDGIAGAFVQYVEDETAENERFGDCLLRLTPGFAGAPSARSARNAARLIQEQLAAVEALDTTGEPQGEAGWGDWLAARVVAGSLSEDARKLLDLVGREIPAIGGLANFLGQLEPVGKDLSTQADAVRIMSMSASKGLTVNSVFVMGVEAGIIPHPRATVDEERRLLYVAMTRATTYYVMTGARRRTGPTARQGAPNVNQPRGRCTLLEGLPIGQWQDGEAFVESTDAATETAC